MDANNINDRYNEIAEAWNTATEYSTVLHWQGVAERALRLLDDLLWPTGDFPYQVVENVWVAPEPEVARRPLADKP